MEWFDGWFITTLLGKQTRVNVKILCNFNVKATFSLYKYNKAYEFNMNKWANRFFHFAHLMEERFIDSKVWNTQIEDFGINTITRKKQHIVNILKYAVVNVFVCLEQIMQQYPNNTVEYAIFHTELNIDSTFEQYIHLMACQCIVQSNLNASNNMDFKMVEFCKQKHEYNPILIESVNSAPAKEVGGHEMSNDSICFGCARQHCECC